MDSSEDSGFDDSRLEGYNNQPRSVAQMLSWKGKMEAGRRSWMFRHVDLTCSKVLVVGCFVLGHSC